jgi:MFS family permease
MTSLFYSFQFFLRSSPNGMSQTLTKEWAINPTQWGFFVSTYYVAYSILQIPVGVSLDVWGPKRVMRVGVLICLAGALLFGLAPSYEVGCLGRLIIGAGAAVSFIGSIRVNSLWFSSTYLAAATGALSAVGKSGSALANKILPEWLASAPSWNHVVLTLTAIGAVLGLIVILFVKNGPTDSFTPAVERIHVRDVGLKLVSVIKRPIIWAMGFYGYSLYLVLSTFTDGYASPFLSQRLGIDVDLAGDIAAYTPIGSAFGASILSFLSDKFRRRKIFLITAASATLLISLMVFYGPVLLPFQMKALLFALGFFSGGQILVFVISAESLSPRLAGMATGSTNALLMLGGVIQPMVVGKILKLASGKNTTVLTEIPVSAYQWAFGTVCACFFVAFLISLRIPETHPARRPQGWAP